MMVRAGRVLAGISGLVTLGAVAWQPHQRHSVSVRVVSVQAAVAMDRSPALSSITAIAGPKLDAIAESLSHDGEGLGPPDPGRESIAQDSPSPAPAVPAGSAAVEQRAQGPRPALAVLESFDGLGAGFSGPQGASVRPLGNPSDNALAVGPNHIVQIVNGGMAVFTKKGVLFDTTGKVLYGVMRTNAIFTGFGGPCEFRNSGDAVVRYDQLAERWLYVLPVFQQDTNVPTVPLTRVSRPGRAAQPGEPGPPDLIHAPAPAPAPVPQPGARRGGPPNGVRQPPRTNPYSMCYAVSVTSDPLGPYYRYEFLRPLFPDYPRPAIWPDGYYTPSSTSDNFIQKHFCVADRRRMLVGLPATEQCLVVDGVNFLNNADIDGQGLPPDGAPNIVMAAGGEQLHQRFEDDGIYAWQFHVDWNDPAKTGVRGPLKIRVAPYHYLCNGQLTNCVPQPDTGRRLDAQGDKLMQRLVYRNVNGHESILAWHSINSSTGGGGVRWYEFRLDSKRDPVLYQQGTYAPDSLYRWLPSGGMDRKGNIGIGYSFGGGSNFPGQRFAGRLAGDPLGQLTFHETVLVQGEASQKNQTRWEDYTTAAMDPSDDCTFWYVGDYVKPSERGYSTRIGAFRMPGCREGTVAGSTFFDTNHDGLRDGSESGLAGWSVDYSGASSGRLRTDASGAFTLTLPTDPAYGTGAYTFRARAPSHSAWSATTPARPATAGITIGPDGLHLRLDDRDYVTGVTFGAVCTIPARGSHGAEFWTSSAGAALMAAQDSNWTRLFDSIDVVGSSGQRVALRRGPAGYDTLRAWLPAAVRGTPTQQLSARFAVAGLNVVSGSIDGNATIADPVRRDWPQIRALLGRASVALAAGSPDAEAYGVVVDRLTANRAEITPARPGACPRAF